MNGERIKHMDIIQMLCSPTLGCDPELFLAQDGKVVGAERFIPAKGLKSSYSTYSDTKNIVLDGVQVELHTDPTTCRAGVGNQLSAIFKTLKAELDKTKGLSASFAPVVKMSKADLAALSEKARELGCMPSLNAYDANASIKVAKDFTTRSAGGHIHVGLTSNEAIRSTLKDPIKLVNIFDAIIGIPSVLIDRSEDAAERRKTYGRAGEHRLPSYGIEYRTLSNFWLKSYQLMSLVMGLAKLSVNIVSTENFTKNVNRWDSAKTLLDKLDLNKVKEAINQNNYDLALECWEPVEAFIRNHVIRFKDYTSRDDYIFPLDNAPGVLENFKFFHEEIKANGIERWFPLDPMEHWCSINEGHGVGWESFLDQVVGTTCKEQTLHSLLTKLKGES